MKHFLVAITVCVLTNLSFATTNFQQGAGNVVSTNADDTFQKLIDACGDVSILGLRARARLEMNRATAGDQSKIVEMMDQAMATCGSGDIEKATEQLNEAIAFGKASVTENFGTDASSTTPVKPSESVEPKEEQRPPMALIIIGLVIIAGIIVMIRRKRSDDDD